MKCPITAVLIVMLPLLLSASLLTVNQDGTADFTVVQEAIQAAADGDSILVYPGTYYENIDFLQKSISLMSLAITTGDEQYIEQTVLNGNLSGSVVMIHSSDEAYLGGFTITGGIGQRPSYPPYHADTLTGGGVIVRVTEATIENCIITDNSAERGGGIYIGSYAYITLAGNVITNNSAARGGGIAFGSSQQQTFSVDFDSDNKNSIYLNAAREGNDIFCLVGFNIEIDIPLEIATVDELDPYYHIFRGSYHLISYSGINYSVEETAVDLVEADLYVATWGSDSNSGLTPDDPLQRISHALLIIKGDSLNQRTIHIEEGVYSRSGTGELMPLPLKSYVTLTSDTNWTLDAEFRTGFAGAVIMLEHGDVAVHNARFLNGLGRTSALPFVIVGSHRIILENIEFGEVFGPLFPDTIFSVWGVNSIDTPNIPEAHISNITIEGNQYGAGGSAITKGNIYIDRVNIKDSSFMGFSLRNWRDSVSTHGSEAIISNSNITGNINYEDWPGSNIVGGAEIRGPYIGYAISADSVKVKVINCTIAGNSSLNGVVNIDGKITFDMYNSLITGNSPNRVFLDSRYGEGSVMFSHVMLDNGLDDINLVGNNYQFTYDNIMSGDPLFLGEGDHPYQLTADSPAINAGTLDIPGYTFGEYDLAGNPRIYGNSIDLGAYEYQYSSVADEFQDEKMNVTVYPNPVNLDKRGSEFYCTISFNLPQQGKLVVEIYNIKGQMVRRLLDVDTPSGEYNIRWNGLNEMGRRVGTGMYFVRIAAAGRETAERVMMIK
jgi:hypothetical protein